MCGIICFLKRNGDNDDIFTRLYEQFLPNINRRGPDSFETHSCSCGTYNITSSASVLWLQGPKITTQPVVSDRSVLLYNGDVFGGTQITDNARHQQGDTKLFLQCLESSDDLMTTLENIHGPYGFLLLDKDCKKLLFARDFYGRRSLVIGSNGKSVIISSVVVKNEQNFIELPPLGLYALDLTSNVLEITPWKNRHKNFDGKLDEVKRILNLEVNVLENKFSQSFKCFEEPSEDILNLYKALKHKSTTDSFEHLIHSNDFMIRVKELEIVLNISVKKRVTSQPNNCSDCIGNTSSCSHPKVGILFSGGLDCSVLALIADKYVPPEVPIDLFNVAFESSELYNTPDRISGRQSFEELQHLCPSRKWNFLPINVTKKELCKERELHIRHLIHPLKTILDDSLGCALWFASQGICNDYASPCRVVLVGMGADELFGGYTRHRATLKRTGWNGLHNCLLEEWQNISHRNLARDDRVVSDHGRQLRTPYLDEGVVQFVQSLHVWERTYPSDDLPQGLGEKILLRALGYHLGLRNAAGLKKRALQFGSRIANKKENAHEESPRL